MTIKELQEILNQFPESTTIKIASDEELNTIGDIYKIPIILPSKNELILTPINTQIPDINY